MTVKTDYSRFHIHDELTAPEGSLKILASVARAGGEVSKLVGVLAGAPSVLRAFIRMRHELRVGVLGDATKARISLAVAERRRDSYSLAQNVRTAREAGLGLDEISAARTFRSADERQAAMLTFIEKLLETGGRPRAHLQEEAREAGWTDEELLEAIAHAALAEFQSLVSNAAELPVDHADSRFLPGA
jgi:alkylhydroperoxidase family enzyme